MSVRGDLLQCFKMLKGINKYNVPEFFTMNQRFSRGHTMKLQKRYCRLDTTKYNFAHRVVDEWNMLSKEIAEAENINEFKSGLERHLRAVRGFT